MKDHNPHYSEIHLPASSDDLINDKLQETEYRIVGDESDSDEIDERLRTLYSTTKIIMIKPFLNVKLSLHKSLKIHINDQYTIYPMHAKRFDNESAFKFYQMLRIEDGQMDNRYKYLNVMCFLIYSSRVSMDNWIKTLHCRIIYLSRD